MTDRLRRPVQRIASLVALIVGLLATVHGVPASRSWRAHRERGLSQSTENAILLAGAVAVAGIVVTAITLYVRNHLP